MINPLLLIGSVMSRDRRSHATLLVASLTVGALACALLPSGPSGTCLGPFPYAVGEVQSGVVGVDDCEDSQSRVGDIYLMALSTQTNFQLRVTPTGFKGQLGLYRGAPGADLNRQAIVEFDTVGVVRTQAHLPAGDYYFVVGTANGNGGAYQVSSQTWAADGCNTGDWTIPGANLSGSVREVNCSSGSARQHVYQIWLTEGQAVTVSATLDRRGAVLWRTGTASSGDLVTRVLNQAGSTTFTFTAPRKDIYRLHIIGEPAATGAIAYSATIR